MDKLKYLFLTLLSIGTLTAADVDLKKADALLSKSVVDVIYKLQYDERGDAPNALGLYCGACNDLHDSDLEGLLENNMDLELSGFLVAPDKVLVPDVLIEERGVEGIFVQLGKERTPAKIIAVYPNEGMLLLQLAKTLEQGNVIKFSAVPEKGQLYAYSRIRELGQWIARLRSFSRQRNQQLWNRSRIAGDMPGASLIIDGSGKVVAVLGNNNELVNLDRWQTPYTQWKAISYNDFCTMKKRLQDHLEKSVFVATLYLKDMKLSNRERLGNSQIVRETNTVVYKLPDGRIFMPILLAPTQNGRLEKVIVHFPQGDVEASVVQVLKDFGGYIIQLKKPVKFPPVAPGIEPMQNKLGMQIWSVDLTIYNKKLDVIINSNALGAMAEGYMQKQYGARIKDKYSDDMLFTLSGKLLGIQLGVRAWNYERKPLFLSAAELMAMLNDPKQTLPITQMSNPIDSVADLGIEYQGLNADLARSGNLEKLTRWGREGLLISYVYPGSTADKLGLKANDVLLKLIVPGSGKPTALTGNDFANRQAQQFPWQQLDKIPEMYYSEIPEPWNGIKNKLNQRLSTIGIGKDVELIAICGGKLVRKRFKIEAAPTYFEIAPRYRSTVFGLEVRDMTFEVRRYFRMQKNTPGVIIYNVFAGSSASTAGLKPFEIITAVNDKPVFSAEDFRKAVTGAEELRLAVRRLASDRVVTVKPKLGPRR